MTNARPGTAVLPDRTHAPGPRSPRRRPDPLSAAAVHALGLPTPLLVVDTTRIRARVRAYRAAFDHRVGLRFAVKCNPMPEVLAAVAGAGGGFEIASASELDLVRAAGAAPADVFSSNPVKPASHVRREAEAGVRRFVVDGPGEIDKIAGVAPGVDVLVRMRVEDAASAFPLSAKFGAPPDRVEALLHLAACQGLNPVGVTFHVGSQCPDAEAWARVIRAVTPIYTRWARQGQPLAVLDIGGGFPARYDRDVPTIADIGRRVVAALDAMPAPPAEVVAEPGRGLVAEAAVMAAEVIGREERDGRTWFFLEVGAYNGLIEAMQTEARWPYPVRVVDALGALRTGGPTVRATVSGPTCDSSDTVLQEAELPADTTVGDVVHLSVTGAYTLCYASSFNGFEPASPVAVA